MLRSLVQKIHDWLWLSTKRRMSAHDYRQIIKDLSRVRASRKFTRDEMNARGVL